jgi:hypothetical protein
MAAAQRLGSFSTLGERSGLPAWRTTPSWLSSGPQDRAIPPESQRFMVNRMKAHTREVNSSHVANDLSPPRRDEHDPGRGPRNQATDHASRSKPAHPVR